MNTKSLYTTYIIIGILYVAVKIVFVSAGYLHPGAIAHGTIPALLTILTGFLALREIFNNSENLVWQKIATIVPVLIFLITPLFMYLKKGNLWLTDGRLPVLVIYECFAVLQVLLSVQSNKKNMIV